MARKTTEWDRVGVVVVLLLEAAEAGGMKEGHAEAVYDSIMEGLTGLDEEAVEPLVAEIAKAICLSEEDNLGRALNNYTNPSHPEYDPEFDAEIRKMRPDWFSHETN